MSADKLRQDVHIRTQTPNHDTDIRQGKKRTRIALGVGAASAAAGTAVLSRNPKSFIGKGLLGIGAAAGLAASEFDAQVQQKVRTKKTTEALEKSVRELNLGRPEGSPAVESFMGAVDKVLNENLDQTKKLIDRGSGFYQESLQLQSNDGQFLTVYRGVTGSFMGSNFRSVIVWDTGQGPYSANATGTNYSVFSNSSELNPRKVIEGPHQSSLPLHKINSPGENADYVLAEQYLASAQVVAEQHTQTDQ